MSAASSISATSDDEQTPTDEQVDHEVAERLENICFTSNVSMADFIAEPEKQLPHADFTMPDLDELKEREVIKRQKNVTSLLNIIGNINPIYHDRIVRCLGMKVREARSHMTTLMVEITPNTNRLSAAKSVCAMLSILDADTFVLPSHQRQVRNKTFVSHGVDRFFTDLSLQLKYKQIQGISFTKDTMNIPAATPVGHGISNMPRLSSVLPRRMGYHHLTHGNIAPRKLLENETSIGASEAATNKPPLLLNRNVFMVNLFHHFTQEVAIGKHHDYVQHLVEVANAALDLKIVADCRVATIDMVNVFNMFSIYGQNGATYVAQLDTLVSELFSANKFSTFSDGMLCALIDTLKLNCSESCTACNSILGQILMDTKLMPKYKVFADLSDLDRMNWHSKWQSMAVDISNKADRANIIKRSREYVGKIHEFTVGKASNAEYWEYRKQKADVGAAVCTALALYACVPGYTDLVHSREPKNLSSDDLEAFCNVDDDVLLWWRNHIAKNHDSAFFRLTGCLVMDVDKFRTDVRVDHSELTAGPWGEHVYDILAHNKTLSPLYNRRDQGRHGNLVSRLELCVQLLSTPYVPLHGPGSHQQRVFRFAFGQQYRFVAAALCVLALCAKTDKATLQVCLDRFEELYRSFKEICVENSFRHNVLCLYGVPRTYKSTFSRLMCTSMGRFDSLYIKAKGDNDFIFSAMGKSERDDPRLFLVDDITSEQWRFIDSYLRSALDGNVVQCEAKGRDSVTKKMAPFVMSSNLNPADYTVNIVTRLKIFEMCNPFGIRANLMDHLSNVQSAWIQLAMFLTCMRRNSARDAFGTIWRDIRICRQLFASAGKVLCHDNTAVSVPTADDTSLDMDATVV